MRGRLIGLAVLTGALLAALAPVAGARECPRDRLKHLSIDGYVRVGESFEIEYRFVGPQHVRDLVVFVDGVEYPLSSDPSGPVKFDAPLRTGRFPIRFEWRAISKCRGHRAETAIAVPTSSTFGDRSPRVDGLWRVQLVPRRSSAPPIRLRWRMRPKCDYYACDTTVTGRGERYSMSAWRGRYVDNQRAGTFCYGPDGRAVRGGYTLRLQHYFWPERAAWINGTLAYHATRIRGETTVEYTLTRTGRAAGCRAFTIKYTLRGVRER